MLEKERKFKLKYLPEGLIPTSIQQGYLFVKYKDQLRVRIVGGKEAYICYKVKTSNKHGVRSEYEYKIPLSDGREMMETAKFSLQKLRYVTEFNGNHVDIDIYPDGLQVVEIEYENDFIDLPDYCGEEITKVDFFSNINIAMRGLCK